MGFWVLAAIPVVAVIGGVWAIATYNRFVKYRTLVEEGWSTVETKLKQRANLIPSLVETVRAYTAHERETLEALARARTIAPDHGPIAERAGAESAISSALAGLRIAVENYPDLKANTSFAKLQDSLDVVEEQIQIARRFYNGTVRNLNIMVDSFPSNVIARAMKIEKAEFFELETAADRAVPVVSFAREADERIARLAPRDLPPEP